MKAKLLLILTILFCQGFFAQCFINGNPEITVGETAAYSLQNNTAKCANCQQWSTLDKNSSIISDSLKSSVQLKGLAPGTSTLVLSGTSDNGNFQCSKTLIIRLPVSKQLYSQNPKCDISSAVFTEKRNGDTIIFIPEVQEKTFFYTWTFSEGNDTLLTSREQNPSFSLADSLHSKIDRVELRIQSNKCMRTVRKTYPNRF